MPTQCRKWHKGETGKDHPKSSGLFKILGDGQKLALYEQEKIGIDYLATNRDELKALAAYPGMTTFILGLQYHIKLEPTTIGFSMGPSAVLMGRALDIGISLTFCVSLDRMSEGEPKPCAEPAGLS